MKLYNPSETPIDPRVYLRANGVEALAELIRVRARYVCQHRPLRTLAKSLRAGKPVYLAGKRGTGKTALGKGFAKAFNLPHRVVQCMDDLTTADILYEFDAVAQGQYVRQQMAAGVSLAEARAGQWTREFLNLGAVLEVYDYANTSQYPPALILDEVDKLAPQTRQKLLQLIDEKNATIPRLKPNDDIGVLEGFEHYPVVIMTSNNLDDNENSRPFRSRCYFVTVREPSLAERILILSTSVPEAPLELLMQVVRLMDYISHQGGIIDKPEIREAKDLLITLVAEGVTELNLSVIDDNICCLAKSTGDEENFIGMVKGMEKAARNPDPRVDGIVVAAYEATRQLVAA